MLCTPEGECNSFNDMNVYQHYLISQTKDYYHDIINYFTHSKINNMFKI